MPNAAFYHTNQLLRINLRRDRWKILVWVLVLVSLFASIAAKFSDLYGSTTAIDQITNTLNTPAMRALFGCLPSGPYTSADVFAGEMTVFMAIFGVIMNFNLAVNLTRGDEERGLTELLAARGVGPYAPLAAAISELLVVNLGLGLLYSVGLQFANLTGTNSNGNFVLGIGLGLNGLLFGLLAILCAQLAASSRAATGLSYGLFGITYMMRLVTDVSHPAYTWLSPFGWVEKFSTYRANNWWPAALIVITSIILILGAIGLRAHRDLNAGIIASRPGPARASALLSGPLGLFWRLERNLICAWLIGLIIFGAMYGSVFNTVANVLQSNPLTAKLLSDPQTATAATTSVLKAFIAVLMIVFTTVSAIPGLQILYRLTTDEHRGTLETVFARPIARWRLNITLLGLGVLTSLAALIASVSGLAIAANTVLTHPLSTTIFYHAILANIPPLLIMIGIGAILVGWWPRWTPVIWGYLGLAFGIGYFGRLFNLAHWVPKLTPFGYIGNVPSVAIDWPTFWWQLAIAVALMVVGWLGYQRRDLISAS
ncbi:ABC transporter permease [Furfurilactobacillus entadae]|uniref:ABC transporter permease n=1 Tax=Furfurilactobacillus entadae TaxID=2922307 RepID=UPI0035E608FB